MRCPGAVAERYAQLPDRFAQDGLVDYRVGPDGVQQFLLRDEHAWTLGQVTQHRPGFRPQRNGFAAMQQEPCAEIQPKGPEDHRRRSVHRRPPLIHACVLAGYIRRRERARAVVARVRGTHLATIGNIPLVMSCRASSMATRSVRRLLFHDRRNLARDWRMTGGFAPDVGGGKELKT